MNGPPPPPPKPPVDVAGLAGAIDELVAVRINWEKHGRDPGDPAVARARQALAAVLRKALS